eukprot:403357080
MTSNNIQEDFNQNISNRNDPLSHPNLVQTNNVNDPSYLQTISHNSSQIFRDQINEYDILKHVQIDNSHMFSNDPPSQSSKQNLFGGDRTNNHLSKINSQNFQSHRSGSYDGGDAMNLSNQHYQSNQTALNQKPKNQGRKLQFLNQRQQINSQVYTSKNLTQINQINNKNRINSKLTKIHDDKISDINSRYQENDENQQKQESIVNSFRNLSPPSIMINDQSVNSNKKLQKSIQNLDLRDSLNESMTIHQINNQSNESHSKIQNNQNDKNNTQNQVLSKADTKLITDKIFQNSEVKQLQEVRVRRNLKNHNLNYRKRQHALMGIKTLKSSHNFVEKDRSDKKQSNYILNSINNSHTKQSKQNRESFNMFVPSLGLIQSIDAKSNKSRDKKQNSNKKGSKYQSDSRFNSIKSPKANSEDSISPFNSSQLQKGQISRINSNLDTIQQNLINLKNTVSTQIESNKNVNNTFQNLQKHTSAVRPVAQNHSIKNINQLENLKEESKDYDDKQQLQQNVKFDNKSYKNTQNQEKQNLSVQLVYEDMINRRNQYSILSNKQVNMNSRLEKQNTLENETQSNTLLNQALVKKRRPFSSSIYGIGAQANRRHQLFKQQILNQPSEMSGNFMIENLNQQYDTNFTQMPTTMKSTAMNIYDQNRQDPLSPSLMHINQRFQQVPIFNKTSQNHSINPSQLNQTQVYKNENSLNYQRAQTASTGQRLVEILRTPENVNYQQQLMLKQYHSSLNNNDQQLNGLRHFDNRRVLAMSSDQLRKDELSDFGVDQQSKGSLNQSQLFNGQELYIDSRKLADGIDVAKLQEIQFLSSLQPRKAPNVLKNVQRNITLTEKVMRKIQSKYSIFNILKERDVLQESKENLQSIKNQIQSENIYQNLTHNKFKDKHEQTNFLKKVITQFDNPSFYAKLCEQTDKLMLNQQKQKELSLQSTREAVKQKYLKRLNPKKSQQKHHKLLNQTIVSNSDLNIFSPVSQFNNSFDFSNGKQAQSPNFNQTSNIALNEKDPLELTLNPSSNKQQFSQSQPFQTLQTQATSNPKIQTTVNNNYQDEATKLIHRVRNIDDDIIQLKYQQYLKDVEVLNNLKDFLAKNKDTIDQTKKQSLINVIIERQNELKVRESTFKKL